MASESEFSDAFRSFSQRHNVPSNLTSEQWESVPAEIRERSFFMARVDDAEVLQHFRTQIDDVLKGKIGEQEAEKRIDMWLKGRGYRPPPGKEGTLQDLSSLKRINVVLRTNIDMARGHAAWVAAQAGIDAFPAQRLYRGSARKEPRDWAAIWAEAKKRLNLPGVAETEMVALLNHPIWREISRFDQPYPPFDFNSGMVVRPVSKAEAKALGILPEIPQEPIYKSVNEAFEETPAVEDEDIKEELSQKLGRFGEWDGKKIVFTDPDGSRPFTAQKLGDIWARPAPPGYDRLTQRYALEAWDGGATPDAQEARINLRKLFDRIVTDEQPGQVFRATLLASDEVAAFVTGMAARQLSIPGNVAGWAWASTLEQAVAGVSGDGWAVIFQVSGTTKAIDISALRPDKPGFVYVGGTVFRILNFTQDAAKKVILIELEEGEL